MPRQSDRIEYGLHNSKHIFNSHLLIQKKIEEHMANKCEKIDYIPNPTLQFFWNFGFLPIMESPTEGMRVSALLNLLSQGKYEDQRHHYKGVWLRDIIKNKIYPEIIKTEEMYFRVGGEGDKFLTRSYFRNEPGTIIR